jgi:tetratricopeptide (TPR) repeat protein
VLDSIVAKDDFRLQIAETKAQFYNLKALAHSVRNETDAAYKCYDQSLSLIESLVQRDPNNLVYQFQLANIYRSLGECAGLLGNLEKRLDYTAGSIKACRELLVLQPNERRYRLQLCWAYYDSSFALEANDQIESAIKQMDDCLAKIDQLIERFPLVEFYIGASCPMYSRRGSLMIVDGKPEKAREDFLTAIDRGRESLKRSPEAGQTYLALIAAKVKLARLDAIVDPEIKTLADELRIKFPQLVPRLDQTLR